MTLYHTGNAIYKHFCIKITINFYLFFNRNPIQQKALEICALNQLKAVSKHHNPNKSKAIEIKAP